MLHSIVTTSLHRERERGEIAVTLTPQVSCMKRINREAIETDERKKWKGFPDSATHAGLWRYILRSRACSHSRLFKQRKEVDTQKERKRKGVSRGRESGKDSGLQFENPKTFGRISLFYWLTARKVSWICTCVCLCACAGSHAGTHACSYVMESAWASVCVTQPLRGVGEWIHTKSMNSSPATEVQQELPLVRGNVCFTVQSCICS